MQDLLRYTRALVLLQIRTLELANQGEKSVPLRLELLLSDAGFGPREIADLLGKNYAGVAKAISRGRGGRSKEQSDPQNEKEDSNVD